MASTDSNTPSAATGAGDVLRRATPLLGIALLADVAIFAVAQLLDADLTVDVSGTMTSVALVNVVISTLLPLLLAVLVRVTLVPRVALVRRLWTPGIVLLTLLSLGGPAGATDVTTMLALGAMHLVVGGIAAFAMPARLDA